MFTIFTSCPICGKATFISVKMEDYINWTENDYLIQDAFPYLSAEERECLITGICPTCWEKMFN